MNEHLLMGMRLARALSAIIEVSAAVLLFRMSDLSSMIRLNGLLGMVGPIIFITVSALGITAGVGTIRPSKIVFIFLGVCLVVWGTRS